MAVNASRVQAAERLYQDNEALALWQARLFVTGGDLLDDARQVARIALWKACLRYDAGRGVRFSTLATRYCRNALITWSRREQVWRERVMLIGGMEELW